MADNPLAQHYLRMAENNRWSNFRLLGACARLEPGELAAERASFFPSLVATLNHNLIVDRFYVDALQGGTLGVAAFANEVPYAEIEPLARAQLEVDLALIDFCANLKDETLPTIMNISRATSVQHERHEDILMHLFTHQIHHRGQAHAMLSGSSVKPPQLDEFYCAIDAPLRRDELARMTTDPY